VVLDAADRKLTLVNSPQSERLRSELVQVLVRARAAALEIDNRPHDHAHEALVKDCVERMERAAPAFTLGRCGNEP
jgi:hypothetical protein